MPTVNDLIVYGTANHAEDDTSTQGGAIAVGTRIVFTAIVTDFAIECVSDTALDDELVTLTGRNAAGTISSSTATLSGTAIQQFSPATVFDRILKIVISGGTQAHTNVTIRGTGVGATVVVMESGVNIIRRLFYDSASAATQKSLYEKVYFRNNHATQDLTSATVTLTAEPVVVTTGQNFQLQLSDVLSDVESDTITNRVTTPLDANLASPTFQDTGVAITVPGGIVPAATAIGCYLHLDLAPSNGAIKDNFSLQLAGTSV